MHEYKDGTGEGLAKEIVTEMENRGDFGSDGASVMTGMDKGVHERIISSS